MWSSRPLCGENATVSALWRLRVKYKMERKSRNIICYDGYLTHYWWDGTQHAVVILDGGISDEQTARRVYELGIDMEVQIGE